MEALLEAGAPLNTPIGIRPAIWSHRLTALGHNARRRRYHIVELLLEYGAAEIDDQCVEYHSVFNSKFQGSLGTNREQLKNTLAHTPQDWKPTLGLLPGYRDADPDIRELVENRFPGILDGSINTLDILLDPDSNKYFSSEPSPLIFPLANLYLNDTRFPGRYSADKAFDDDLGTFWVEGDDGPGLGEKIAFELPPDVQKLEIFAGYGEDRYHLPNNRVKKAVLAQLCQNRT